ncbi:MAG: acetate--CoA ligase family protein [Promethearchaeota archaeon]
MFGANNDILNTMGSMQLRNIIAGGFKGKIYPIHPRLTSVQGIKAYKSVLDLSEVPDMAFIILPPKVVPQVMEECGQKGIKRLIITSGGFREAGPEGIILSDKIDRIAKKYGMRFIGPNCLGVFNGWYDAQRKESYLNTMWISQVPKRGKISITSQSGTIACHLAWHSRRLGVKIGKSFSNGNERNVDIVDFLNYLKDDPETNVIGLYLEEIKRGKEFIELAREVSKDKPIVAIYAGGTEATVRSILSHTGSIGGNQKIYDAMFKKTGIISTDSITDFLYYLKTFSWAKRNDIFPKGNRVGIITDSGGAGAMMTKTSEMYGLEVPEFSEDLQEKLRAFIPPTASANNPLDVTFDMDMGKIFLKYPEIIAKSGEIDGILLYGVFDFGEIFKLIYESTPIKDDSLLEMDKTIEREVIGKIKKLIKTLNIPIFYIGPQPYESEMNQKFLSRKIPIFDLWDQPTKCFAALLRYSHYRQYHL